MAGEQTTRQVNMLFWVALFFREVNKYLHAKQIDIIKGTLFYAT